MVALSLCFSMLAGAQETNVVLPPSVPDPIEPFHRAMWAFNKGLMTDVIKPTSRVYRFVVVKPVRTGIGNFGGVTAENIPAHGRPFSLKLTLPPLGALFLKVG